MRNHSIYCLIPTLTIPRRSVLCNGLTQRNNPTNTCSWLCIFLIWEQHYPECLLQTRLVQAGNEANSRLWFCLVCRNRIDERSFSARCNRCMQWVHIRNCSVLNRIHQYSYRVYIASCCGNVDPQWVITFHSLQSPQQQFMQQLKFKMMHLYYSLTMVQSLKSLNTENREAIRRQAIFCHRR